MQQLRIGFAFNQKPTEDAPEGEDEPPSRYAHDRYAEWDDPATIDAVEAALARAEIPVVRRTDIWALRLEPF